MKLTTKGRYAVTAILDMVVYGGDQPVNLTDIAEREAISEAYLAQLFSRLGRAGIVTGVRGPGGGYLLSVPAKQLTVIQVLEAAGEPLEITRCQGNANCQDGGTCLTHSLWHALDNEMYQFLNSMNFARVAALAVRSDESPKHGLSISRNTACDKRDV